MSLTTLSLAGALSSAVFVGCATQEDEGGSLGDGLGGSSAGFGGSGGAGSAAAAGKASTGGTLAQAGTPSSGGSTAGSGGAPAGGAGASPGVAGTGGSPPATAGSAGAPSAGTNSGGSGGTAAGGTGAVEPDNTPPSAPGSLQATAITSSSVTVTWNASSDNVGVTGYRLFNGNTEVTTTTGTIHTFKGLNASTAYTFGVEAYDAEDNTSTRAKKNATTSAAPACDAGSAVATLSHGQSYSVTSTACLELSVNQAWNPVNILLEQTDGGTISYAFNSCKGSGSGTISGVLKMYEGSTPACNFFVRLSGSGSVTYYD